MAFQKLIITYPGSNFIFEDLGIEIKELPTGGYKAFKSEICIDEDAVLKTLVKRIVNSLPDHPEWSLKKTSQKSIP